ncbi:MAG: hypothetical protein GY711_04700 [bacterium]|nr:hypothetical protein [bacterium]
MSGGPRPIETQKTGAASAAAPTGKQGAAFRALLDKLENEARGLRQASESLEDPAGLPGAVDRARASLDDALSLGDQLLEAYRASRHQESENQE